MYLNRILLTNDDGIDAEGLALLIKIAGTLSDDVWVVAPQTDQSGMSNALSLHDPLRIIQKAPRAFSVSGSPSDCVVMAVKHIMKDTPPSLVLSGINRGANIGGETILSGTVGAAITANLLGIKSIALSQLFISDTVDWTIARERAGAIVSDLAQFGLEHSDCLNVNFPACALSDLKDVVFTQQGRGGLYDLNVVSRRDSHARDYHWIAAQFAHRSYDAESEGAVLRDHNITITPLQMDRTHHDALRSLRGRALV